MLFFFSLCVAVMSVAIAIVGVTFDRVSPGLSAAACEVVDGPTLADVVNQWDAQTMSAWSTDDWGAAAMGAAIVCVSVLSGVASIGGAL